MRQIRFDEIAAEPQLVLARHFITFPGIQPFWPAFEIPQGVVADFGRSTLPEWTSRPVATPCAAAQVTSTPTSFDLHGCVGRRALPLYNAWRHHGSPGGESPFRQKGPTLTINRDDTRFLTSKQFIAARRLIKNPEETKDSQFEHWNSQWTQGFFCPLACCLS
jgi:hypothetical protein